MVIQFVTIREVEVQDGDLLLYNGSIKNDYYIMAYIGNEQYALISLKNGNRWNDPCSKEELKNKVEKDGDFSYFGKLNFGNEEESEEIL